MADADDQRSERRGRLYEQRDRDKEQIDAWMQGSGAEILAAVAVILGLGFGWTVFSDSPLLFIGIVFAVGGYLILKRLDIW